MDDMKRVSQRHIGPGGITCPCCNDYFTRGGSMSHKKTLFRRYARRIMRQRDRATFSGASRGMLEYLEGWS
jgi:hypothetical protein